MNNKQETTFWKDANILHFDTGFNLYRYTHLLNLIKWVYAYKHIHLLKLMQILHSAKKNILNTSFLKAYFHFICKADRGTIILSCIHCPLIEQPQLEQGKAGARELYPSLPHGWQGPDDLSRPLLPLGLHSSRELDGCRAGRYSDLGRKQPKQ